MADPAESAAVAAVASESIAVRSVRLNQLFLERSSSLLGTHHLMSRETLLDSLSVLYEECQHDPLKKDRNVAIFIEKFRTTMSALRKLRVNVGDFVVKKVIGRGHFGDVHVVREKHTSNVYAMKVLHKSDTLAQHDVAFYDEERDIMAKANSIWITRLHYAFQDATNLYLIMEFLPGGDLLSFLDRHDGVLSEDVARFFLAEMVLAIHALHCMSYVHRDIKPDNVLIDRTGHIKLADFGSSARVSRFDTVSSRMPVGTPDYIAPEVLASVESKKGSYGRSCDFWSLGIVAYEMLYGRTPFSESKVAATYNNIMNYEKALKFGDDVEVSEKAKRLMEGLLTEPVRRLNFEGLCRHQFFEAVDWDGIRESLPPFVPNVVGEDDTSNFEEFEAVAPKMDIPDLPKQHGCLSGKNLPFVGFTYTQSLDFPREGASRKSMNNFESQLLTKKKEVAELRLKVDSLEKLVVAGKGESDKLAVQLCEQEKIKLLAERECERLCKELSLQKNHSNSYKRLVEFERAERVKTEKKAMELLKDIKEKWKNAEKQKMDELCKENDSLKKFVRELEHKYRETKIEALTLREEIAPVVKMAENAAMKAKHYKAKLRRSSASDALTLETVRQQLNLAERRLSDARQEREAIDVQLDMFRTKADSLEGDMRRLERAQGAADATQGERVRELGKQLDDLKIEHSHVNRLLADKESQLVECTERIEELEARLKEQSSCCQQKFQSVEHREEVKEEGSDRFARPSDRQSFRRARLGARLEEVEAELQRVKGDNERLQDELLTAMDSDSDKTHTLEELRLVVDRLECGLKRLDSKNLEDDVDGGRQAGDRPLNEVKGGGNGDLDRERVIFFEAQISKLEAQLEKAKEALLQEKQAARELRGQWFKMDRELRDVKIDLRIATREAKSASEQSAAARDKATASDDALHKAEAELEALRKESAAVRMQLDTAMADLQRNEKSWNTEKARLTEKIEVVQSSSREVHDLLKKLGESEGRSRQLEKQLKTAEDSVQRAEEDKRQARQLEDQARAESKKTCSDWGVMQINLNCLKQACQSMEEQLSDYEQLVEVHESEEARLEGEVAAAHKTIESLRAAARRADELAAGERTETESVARRADEVARRLEMANVVHESEMQSIVAQRNEYRAMATELGQQVADLEGELRTAESQLGGSRYRQAALDAETIRIKEEAAQLITQIHSLRDTNFKLSRRLEEADGGRAAAEAQSTELADMLREERVAHHVQQRRWEETIAQHAKLIHFLQMKAEHKKKKTFTEKLFGSRNGNGESNEAFSSIPPPSKTSFRKTRDEETRAVARQAVTAASSSSETVDGDDVARSPQSKDVPNTITKSPGVRNVADRSPTKNGTVKPSTERMRHNIPHQFETILCMHATKCAACLEGIHFGRNVARCTECHVSAHPKCASSMPNVCGLPTGLVQHFRHSMRRAKGKPKGHSDADGMTMTASRLDLCSWLKVPLGGGRQGWERKFAQLDGDVLHLYDEVGGGSDDGHSDLPTDTLELRPATGGTVVKVIEDVAPLEMTATAKSDLPYIFELIIEPATTCWPARHVYFMAASFQEKLDWVAALSRVAKSNLSTAIVEQELLGSVLLSIDDASNVDLNCVAFLDRDTVLIGAEDGLYVVDLMDDEDAQPKLRVPSFGPVYQMAVELLVGIVILIAGADRRLYWIDLSDVCSIVNEQTEFVASHLSKLQSIDNVGGCHLFVVNSSRTAGDLYMCAATADRVHLFRWNASMKSFCVRKQMNATKPCSCALFTDNSVIVGADKFYEVDLGNLTVEDFLDESDASLRRVVHAAHLVRSFPMAAFDVAPVGTRPEYLLCFYESGVFVDAFGRRSRRDDLRWTRLPLAFAFRWPYLYIVQLNGIEVYEIVVHKEKCFSVQTFVELSSPRYLGASPETGTIVVATVKDGQADVHCFNGEAAVAMKASRIVGMDSPSTAESGAGGGSKVDNDGDDDSNCETEFSFSSSVMQALEDDGTDDGSSGNDCNGNGGRRGGHESQV